MALSVKNMLGGGGGLPSYPYVWEKYNYDYVTRRTATELSGTPYSLNVCPAISYHGKLYIFSSNESTNNTKYSVWNENGDRWDTYDMPYACYQGVAIIFEDKIHLLGGSGANSYFKHYTFDGTNFEEDVSIPYQFYRGCAVVFNDELHIMASGNSNYQRYHYKLDRSSNSWVSVATLPMNQGYAYASAFVYNNEIYLLGGSTTPTTLNVFRNGAWVVSSVMPCPVNRSSVVEYNNKFYILGGSDYRQCYTFDGNVWERQSNLPYDLYGGCAVVLNGELHILGSGVTSDSTKHFLLYKTSLGKTDYIEDVTSPSIDTYPSKGILGDYYYVRGEKPLYSWNKYSIVDGIKVFIEYVFDKEADKYPNGEMYMGYYYEASKDIHIANGNIIEAYQKDGNNIDSHTFVEVSVNASTVNAVQIKAGDGPSDVSPTVFKITESFGIVAFAYSSSSYHYLYCFCYNVDEYGAVTIGNILDPLGSGAKRSGEDLIIYKIDDGTVGIVHSQGTTTEALTKLTFSVGDVWSLAYTGQNTSIMSKRGNNATSTMLSDGKILVMLGYSGYADLWIYDPTVENFTTTSPKVVIDNTTANTSYGASFSKPIGEDRFILTYSHGYSLYMCICSYDATTGDVTVTSKTLLEGSVASNYRRVVDIVLTSENSFDVFCMLGDSTSTYIAIPCKIQNDFLYAFAPIVLSTEYGTYTGIYDNGDGVAVVLSKTTTTNYLTLSTYFHNSAKNIYTSASNVFTVLPYPTKGIKCGNYAVFLYRNANGYWSYASIGLPLKIEATLSNARCDGIALTSLSDFEKGLICIY